MNEITREEIERAIEFMYGQRTQAANLFLRNTNERVIELINRIVGYYDLAMEALRAELTRQENAPLTWNERINQMTVEEKAKWLYDLDVCRVSSISIDECNSYRHCIDCMKNMLASPYTEGATK